MVSISHENLAMVYGVCLSPNELTIVTQYCIKGSVEVSVINGNLVKINN